LQIEEQVTPLPFLHPSGHSLNEASASDIAYMEIRERKYFKRRY